MVPKIIATIVLREGPVVAAELGGDRNGVAPAEAGLDGVENSSSNLHAVD